MKLVQSTLLVTFALSTVPAIAGWQNFAFNKSGKWNGMSECQANHDAIGVDAKAQSGYGVIDMRLKCQRPNGSTYFGNWGANNPVNQWRSYEQVPADFTLSGLSGKEQGSYGVVDLQLNYTHTQRLHRTGSSAWFMRNPNGRGIGSSICPAGKKVQKLNVISDSGHGVVDFRVFCKPIKKPAPAPAPLPGKNMKFGPFANGLNQVLATLKEPGQSKVKFELSLDIEDGYDKLIVRDGNGNRETFTGQITKVLTLATPVTLRIMTDSSVQSKLVKLKGIKYAN